MNALALIVALSTIAWYFIDRVKPLWANVKNGKYITITLAAVIGVVLAFSYNLDIIYSFEMSDSITFTGKIITALLMMSGSSAISEIIAKIKSV